MLFYRTFDSTRIEKIKLKKKPSAVLLENKNLPELKDQEGFEWRPMSTGGLLLVRMEHGKKVLVLK